MARERMQLRGIERIISIRKNEPRDLGFDQAAYRERNKGERLISRFKQLQRIATRYENRAANYLAMIKLGVIMLWLPRFAEMP